MCARRFLGVLLVEGVGEAGALDRRLLDAVHRFRGGDAGHFEDGGNDVDDVHELLAQAALVLDAAGPGDGHVLADAAELGGILLEPGERRVKGPGPAGGHVVVGLLGAPDVIPFHLGVDGHLVDAVEEGHFVRRAERAALGAGAVVAVDVDDERVVEFAHLLDGVDDAADLMIAVGGVGGEDFDLLDEELLGLGIQFVPGLEDILRPRCQLGVGGDHAELLLVFEDAFSGAPHSRRRRDACRGSSSPIPRWDGAARGWRRARIS